MALPEKKHKYQTGDFVPIKTPLGNVIETQILDDEWKLNPYDENSDKVIMYDSRALIFFLDWLEFRRNNKFDNIIITSGWERSGKSMCTIGEKMIYDSPKYRDKEIFDSIISRNNWKIEDFVIDVPLKLNQVCFDLDDYHTEISNCKENMGDFTILDEAGFRLFALEWWDQNQVNLIKEFQVIGKRRMITNLNVPHKDDLNNRIRDRRVTAWQNVFTIQTGSRVERGFVEIRNANPDKWQLQVYWNPFLMCKFPNLEDIVKPEWSKYEAKKDKFIDEIIQQQVEMLQNQGDKLSKREEMYFDSFCILVEKMVEGRTGKDGYTYSEIARHLGISQPTLFKKIERFKAKREKELEYARILEKQRQEKLKQNEEIEKVNGVPDEPPLPPIETVKVNHETNGISG